ncbi:LytR C-terminal domain-containing protein [Knoellia sp. S7-12]|uniref:LytR C-terminal domain-containing protein n=1 Tax=Knoellia sp. S7-12 TaxID=3126698 RepID=UPI003368A71B
MFRKQGSEPERSPLPVRAVSAASDLARRSVGMTRDTVHKELLERAKSQEAMSDEQIWRRYQFRHLAAFVTIPALLLGTASIATAYGTGLLTSDPKPAACEPVVVLAPAPGSFKVKVLNSSGVNGAGQVVGRDLSRRGFVVGDVSTAPRGLYVKAPARIYHGKAGLDQALLVAQTIAGSELEYDGRAGTGVALVIGADFTTMLPAPPPKPPEQKSYTVNVYNATWRAGLAKTALSELTARGFSPGKQGNDPDKSFLPNDVAVIRHGPEADLAAEQVARHIKGAVLSEVPRDNMIIDVVIGNKFETVTPLAQMPKKQVTRKDPPHTVSRPCK